MPVELGGKEDADGNPGFSKDFTRLPARSAAIS